jgi:hypothetical protein
MGTHLSCLGAGAVAPFFLTSFLARLGAGASSPSTGSLRLPRNAAILSASLCLSHGRQRRTREHQRQ